MPQTQYAVETNIKKHPRTKLNEFQDSAATTVKRNSETSCAMHDSFLSELRSGALYQVISCVVFACVPTLASSVEIPVSLHCAASDKMQHPVGSPKDGAPSGGARTDNGSRKCVEVPIQRP